MTPERRFGAASQGTGYVRLAAQIHQFRANPALGEARLGASVGIDGQVAVECGRGTCVA